jgi:hypothetical protein
VFSATNNGKKVVALNATDQTSKSFVSDPERGVSYAAVFYIEKSVKAVQH